MNDLAIAKISAQATGSDLYLAIIFDKQEIFSQNPKTDMSKITWSFDDNKKSYHTLEIKMFGKRPEHTRLDDSGNIIEDRWIEISGFEINGINMDNILYSKSIYEHDTNGTTEAKQDKFSGYMGCNGSIRLDFESPIFSWILENI